MENNKKKWNDILIFTCYFLISTSIPFNLFIKNELVVNIINIIIKSLFIVFSIFYIKKYNFSKIELKKLRINSLLFLPFLLICASNFYVCFIDKIVINKDINILNLIINLLLCLLTAINEEIVFRGVIFKEFKNNNSNFKAILYSSIAFGLVHILNISSIASIPYTLLQCLYSFALGLVLSLAYCYSKNLIISILIHFLFNFLNDYLVNCLYDYAINKTFFIVNILVAIIFSIYGIIVYKYFKRKDDLDATENMDI